MQLRRALPLSLAALLAGTGCTAAGPEPPPRGPVPPRTSVPSPTEREAAREAPRGPSPTASPPPPPRTAPAGGAEQPPSEYADPPLRGEEAAVRPTARASAPAVPRRVQPPRPRPVRQPRRHNAVPSPEGAEPSGPEAFLPYGDDPCAAAEGAVPPSVMDLCVRQYGH
ncbi:hypothetical protein SUDANB120_00738 [Streptomyces sp. enrichment culture]|uniref:hypothetical protein n=1 Tax=Streptomyces sp. enrichment culture TaxID=1795815 RepID=UPI003F5592BE